MHHRRRSRRRDKRTMLPCGCCEDIRGGKALPRIDEDEVCNGKVKKTKPRPKKDKCPVNRTHEWYKEEVREKDWYRLWTGARVDYERHYWKWTCIYCWKVRTKPIYDSPYRKRKRLIPKRPVKF